MMKKIASIKIYVKSLLSLLITAVITFSFCLIPSAEENDDYVPRGDRIIVSLGDSYSSGEGNDPMYGHNEPMEKRVKNQDWLAHRSEKAWPGLLMLNGVKGTMKENRYSHWFFAASSGAVANNIMYDQNRDYDKGGDLKGSESITAQIKIFDDENLEGKTVDYVTMTMGGNDAGFENIVKEAAMNLNVQQLRDMLIDAWTNFYKDDGIREHLIDIYNKIYDRTNKKAKIIIAGYPPLFSENGSDVLFSQYEAVLIDKNVSLFNTAIGNAVAECKADGMNIYFTSIEDLFKGHSAFDSDPYINEIEVIRHEDDWEGSGWINLGVSSYSIHPNEKGHIKYAERINEVLKYLDNQRAPRKPDPRFTQVEDPGERDVVMVLDTSGSMDGDPIEKTKEAAGEFIDSVNESEANIGIVCYSDNAEVACSFTLDSDILHHSINIIQSGGATNIDDGLKTAESMLSSKAWNAKKKIIVLMSDGQANRGRTGEELIEYANQLKNQGIYIYTLGFFDALSSSEKSECQYVMEKIASDGCHYEVTDADSLVFFFGDIADQINGQKYIYIRIACPVDVTVLHNGERLDSSDQSLSTRASFGTLTFEDSDTQSMSLSDYDDYDAESAGDRVKILRLKEGEDYDIRISGTGEGTMDYKIGFMDESGEYADFREFEDVAINSKTQIYTMASVSDTTVMNVDSDGDGEYDLSYEAKANGKGKIAERTTAEGSPIGMVFIISLIAVVLMAAILLFIKIRHERKERSGE